MRRRLLLCRVGSRWVRDRCLERHAIVAAVCETANAAAVIAALAATRHVGAS